MNLLKPANSFITVGL